MNIEINKAKSADAEDMIAVKMLASFTAYVDGVHGITEEDMIAQCGPEAIDKLKEGLASKKIRGWVIIDKEKGEIIGSSTAKIKKDKVIFSTIHLLPEYHGMGFGRTLVNEMLEWAKKEEKPIVCFVVAFNTIRIEWYKRLGFEKDGEMEWRLETGKVVPRIRMIKSV